MALAMAAIVHSFNLVCSIIDAGNTTKPEHACNEDSSEYRVVIV
jgi:hypothetical protein